jgi:hypothetical protein
MRVNGLNERVTIWSAVDNGMGGYSYSAPRPAMCRWEEKAEMFRNARGDEQISRAIVYLDVDAAAGDWIYRGESDDPTPPIGSLEIQMYGKSPDIRTVSSFRKAYL